MSTKRPAPKRKTKNTTGSPEACQQRPCSEFTIFANSLRRMADFYSSHPSPGLIQPVDAIQMALYDAAGAAEYAEQGKQWVKPGVWEKPNVQA